jgi:hypothetical protein
MSLQLSANEQRQLQARKTAELQAIYRASLIADGFVDASGQVRLITRTRDPERTNVCLHLWCVPAAQSHSSRQQAEALLRQLLQ